MSVRGNDPSAGPTAAAAPAQFIKVSMREFLRSGAFGPLRIGATREQVRAALGEPDNWSFPQRRQCLPAIWKYGVVELHFDPATDTVYLIHADDFEHLHAGPGVDLDPWWMHRDATLEQARAELAAAHLRFKTVGWRFDDCTVHLVVGGGTELVFARQLPQRLLAFSRSAIHLDRLGSGVIGDMWASAVSVELRCTGEARYTLRLVGPSGPVTIDISTTRKSSIRAEYRDDRPPWIALSTRAGSKLELLRAEYCDFHLEHVDRDRYIMGFVSCDRSWHMAIVADGDIKTRIGPALAMPTADG